MRVAKISLQSRYCWYRVLWDGTHKARPDNTKELGEVSIRAGEMSIDLYYLQTIGHEAS